ncbi:hypothetical protein D3C87_1549610 [compost metagenome]
MLAKQKAENDGEQIAGQQAIDRLTDGRCVLLHVKQEDDHQLAGEKHDRSRRDDPERQLHVKDRRKVGLDEVHHTQGSDENAEAQPGTKLQQPDHRRDIDQCFADEKNEIGVGHAREEVPVSPGKPLGGKLKENFTLVADGPELRCKNQLLCEVLPLRHSRDQPTVVRISNKKPRIAPAMAFINGGQACNRRYPRSTCRAARFCQASRPLRRW